MVLSEEPEPGTPLVDVLPIRDQVLDVTPTVNRVDLLSMVGLAREVAALLGGELHPPAPEDPALVDPEPVDVTIDDFGACPRYIARVFRDVAIAPSPQWLRSRLYLADMRSISNVVDVTNYVMHVWGSPLHAFDRSKLSGGRIAVRHARAGEEVRTLDGTLRRLDTDDLLITDGERAVALAAIMGGEDSEVTSETTRGAARGGELRAARHPPLVGAARASHGWLQSLGEGRRSASRGAGRDPREPHARRPLGSPHDGCRRRTRWVARAACRSPPARARVEGHRPRDPHRTSSAQRSAGFGFDVADDWDVTVPTWRAREVTREIDLVEEIARPVLDRIPYTMPLRRHVRGRLTHGAAAPPGRRGHAGRGRPLRGIHVESRRLGSESGRDPTAEPDDLRSGDPEDDDSSRTRSTPRAPAWTPERRPSPSSRLRGSTSRPASRLPDEHWRVAGVVARRLRGREGCRRDAVSRARARASRRARRARAASSGEGGADRCRAGSASFIPLFSPASGARSSSISRRSSPSCRT